VELLAKQKPDKRRKGVVGMMGRIMPIRPTVRLIKPPVKKNSRCTFFPPLKLLVPLYQIFPK
jgi:hypothetical protein